jgi:hypothetical protein
MKRSQVAILALVPVLAVASCATQTRLETSWELPGFQGGEFKKLAVVGIMKNDDDGNAFESAVVAGLSRANVAAVPGFSFLHNEKHLSRSQMEDAVKSTGADAVLLFKEIALDTTKSYVPPTSYVVDGALYPYWWSDPYWGYYHPYPFDYWGYWYPAVQVVTEPGYWETHNTYRVEAALYRVSDNKLVWTAISDTYDPSNQADLGTSLSAVVLKKLEAVRLV